MKKVFLSLVLMATVCFALETNYSETNSAVKNQVEIFVGASELP